MSHHSTSHPSTGLPCAALALLLLASCATRYDARRVDERTAGLYGASTASSDAVESDERSRDGEAELFEGADLARYLAFGLGRSADLRAAFEAWLASTERVAQVSSLPDPTLSFGEFIEEVQTRTGPQERRFGLAQAFPWPGKLDASARLAAQQAEVRWQHVEAVRLRVAREIEVAYHDYAFLGRELAITRELLDLVRGLEPVVQGRIRGGAGQADILRLQVEVGRLEDDVASLERRRVPRSARLADAMGLPRGGGATLPLPEAVVPAGALEGADELLDRALARSPKLLALEEALETARAAEDLAGFQRRPSFSARFEAIQTGDAPAAGTPGSGNDPTFLGVSMTLPVWLGSYAAAEREAEHRVRVARAELDDGRTRIAADLAEEAYRVDDAQRRIQLYRESLIPRAREALSLTTSAYRAGEANVLDILDSERALLEFELSLWRACRDSLQGRARLTEILGGQS